MAMPHPLDPPIQWAAAATCGKLVAQGVLEARDIIPQLVAAALRGGYPGAVEGLQGRLTWHVNDTADHWRRERDRAEFIIRRDLAPMLAALAAGEEIMAAAEAINTRQGEPLLPSEVRAVVESEMAAVIALLRRNSNKTRRRRHAR